jgi:hypothetical protein
MDRLETYRQIIRETLEPYIDIAYANVNAHNKAVFDSKNDQYLIVSVGWSKERRVHGCLIHVSIEDDKVWIQRDGTEHGITNQLVQAGIPKSDIVLGFHEPEIRLYTGFATTE